MQVLRATGHEPSPHARPQVARQTMVPEAQHMLGRNDPDLELSPGPQSRSAILLTSYS